MQRIYLKSEKDGLTFFPWIHRHFWALSKIKTFIRKYFVKCSLPGFHQVLVAIFMIPLATGFGPTSPQPVMSQPYPVPLPQPKSCPLPDSRGIPDTFNLFLLGKPIGPDKSHSTSAIGGYYCVHDCDIDCISRD